MHTKWNIDELLKGICFASKQQNSTEGSRPWFELKRIKVVRNFPVLYMTWLSEDLYKANYRDRIQLSSGQAAVTEHSFCISHCASCCESTVMKKTARVVKELISDGGKTNSRHSVYGYYPRCRVLQQFSKHGCLYMCLLTGVKHIYLLEMSELTFGRVNFHLSKFFKTGLKFHPCWKAFPDFSLI